METDFKKTREKSILENAFFAGFLKKSPSNNFSIVNIFNDSSFYDDRA